MSLLWKTATESTPEPPSAEDKKHYLRGWRASQNYKGGFTSPLERADTKGEPQAWYTGYYDHAGDYSKFHGFSCPGADKCPEHEEYYL